VDLVDIGIFGATGTIGHCVLAEAATRRHRVTAFTRDASRIPQDTGTATWKVANVLDAESVAAAIDGLDVVVNAINAGKDIADTITNAYVLPAVARC
jgi:putative NADH-flavin reductase